MSDFHKIEIISYNTQLTLKYYIARNFHSHSDGKKLVTCLMTIVISKKIKIIKPVLSTHYETFSSTSEKKNNQNFLFRKSGKNSQH